MDDAPVEDRVLLPDRLEPERLREGTRVKVVGAGGVGGILFRYLAVFLGATGRSIQLFAVDGDRFEAGNASRMLFRSHGNKAEVLVEELRPHFEGTALVLHAIPEYVEASNLGRIVREGDVVFVAVDNHATRLALARHADTLSDVVLISAGNDGVGDEGGVARRGTYANVQVHVRRGGHDVTPPLTHLHPEIAHPADRAPNAPHCTDLVTSVPQVLFTNLAASSLALNAFLLWASEGTERGRPIGALHYSELGVDIAEGRMRPLLPWSGAAGAEAGTRVGGEPGSPG